MDFYSAFRTARDWMAAHPQAWEVPPAHVHRRAAYERAWAENLAYALCAVGNPRPEELVTAEDISAAAQSVPMPTPAHLDEAARDLDAIAEAAVTNPA